MFLKAHKASSREGNGTPLQYSCLENPRDGGAWSAAVHGVAKSWTRLSDFTFTFHFDALEKEMAAHSIVLAWRIPGTGEPGGLPSLGSHKVGHDWSDLAAAAAAARHPEFKMCSLVSILHFCSVLTANNQKYLKGFFVPASKVMAFLCEPHSWLNLEFWNLMINFTKNYSPYSSLSSQLQV